jgi:hypothetical protein
MRFFYLDAAFSVRHGHHGEYCRLLSAELRSRGIEPVVLGHREVIAELRQELGVRPFFRWWTYLQIHRKQDPIAGWLRDFEVAWRLTLDDLQRITPLSADDIVYFNSVYPAQFMALLQWLSGIPKEMRPRAFVEFGTDPGVVISSTTLNNWQLDVPDPRRDPRGTLYRYVGSIAKPEDYPKVCLFTFDRMVSRIYQTLVGWPVATLPWPHHAMFPVRNRAGNRPIKAAVVGHQRLDKGYQFIPDVLRQLQDAPEIEFLVHNSAPEEMIETQIAIREMARANPRVIVDERSVFGADWALILDRADLVICPYDPVRYASSHSAVVAECIANGIPCVAPANTILANMCREFGGMAAEIQEWSAAGMVAGIRAGIAEFDTLAVRAVAAAQRWQQVQGASRLVDQLLGRGVE